MAKRKKKSALDKLKGEIEDALAERDEAATKLTAVDELLAGYQPVPGPSLVSAPQLAAMAPPPESATGVGPDGPGALPELIEEHGFLGAFWPLLVALGAGLLAFFWLGWSWWASALAGVAALILARLGAAFMQGSGEEA